MFNILLLAVPNLMDFLRHVSQNFIFMTEVRNLIFLMRQESLRLALSTFRYELMELENVHEQIKGKFYVFRDV